MDLAVSRNEDLTDQLINLVALLQIVFFRMSGACWLVLIDGGMNCFLQSENAFG